MRALVSADHAFGSGLLATLVERHDETEDRLTRVYRRVMQPLIRKPALRLLSLAAVVMLLVAAMVFVPLGWVTVKMLPFDNKSELQVMVRLPDDTPLEATAGAAAALADEALDDEAVTSVQSYTGAASPYTFNGLVRHYFLRRQANLADLQIVLAPKDERLLGILDDPSASLANGDSALLRLTGWSPDSLNALLEQFFANANVTNLTQVEKLRQVYDAYVLVKRCGLSAAALISVTTNDPGSATVAALQSTLRALYAEAYADEPFVELAQRPPGMHDVENTNICRISVHGDRHDGRVVVLAAIDNLWKGTSSQAVQNLNLMFGFDEGEGI